MQWLHRRSGDTFRGGRLLYLTAEGARTGQPRTHPVGRFDDGAGGWYVVASFGGSAHHPAWYHNVVAHPDRVWAEVDGQSYHVAVDQLEGHARQDAWAIITGRSASFLTYAANTDRTLPVLRLTPRQ
jgi:deazaflavin-dependent oxidoreductase (nitroreductase family)